MASTHLPLHHNKLILKFLDQILLESDHHLPLFLPVLQSGKMMEHLPKVLLLVLPQLAKETLLLPTTLHAVIQRHQVRVNPIKD